MTWREEDHPRVAGRFATKMQDSPGSTVVMAPVDWAAAVKRGGWGPMVQHHFDSVPERDRPATVAYLSDLPTLDDKRFVDNAIAAISDSWDQGYVPSVECRLAGCFEESERRLQEAGHKAGCAEAGLYGRAHRRAMLRVTGENQPAPACTCGAQR